MTIKKYGSRHAKITGNVSDLNVRMSREKLNARTKFMNYLEHRQKFPTQRDYNIGISSFIVIISSIITSLLVGSFLPLFMIPGFYIAATFDLYNQFKNETRNNGKR